MTTLFNDELYDAETGLLREPSSGIGIAPSKGSASSAEKLTDSDQGLLGRLQRGLWGYSSKDAAQARTQMKEREIKLHEFKTQADALKIGVELLENTPSQAERDAFIKSYGDRLDKLDPGLGNTFASLAENQETANEIIGFGQDSDSIMRAYEVGGVKAVRRLLSSPEALRTIQAEIDAKRLPILTKKAQAFMVGWQQIVPPEMVEQFNKDGRLSASELARANEWIKTNRPELVKGLGISDRDWAVIHRNADAFYGALDMISPKDETEVRKKKAIDDDKGKPSPSRQIRRGRKIVTQEWTDGKWADVAEGDAFKPEKPGALTASQERTNTEIDAARVKVEALSDDDIKRLTQKTTDTGRENPSYDATVARDVTLAQRKKYGDDPDHEKITQRIAGRREAQAKEQQEYERAVETLSAQLKAPNLTSAMRKDIQGRLDKAHALAKKKGLKFKK